MKSSILTKKDIYENLRITRRSGFNKGYDYNATVRGFSFESLKDQVCGEIYKLDDKGDMERVASCENKKEVVNAIYDWFKYNAPKEFDK